MGFAISNQIDGPEASNFKGLQHSKFLKLSAGAVFKR
jgi:hypothetical protein